MRTPSSNPSALAGPAHGEGRAGSGHVHLYVLVHISLNLCSSPNVAVSGKEKFLKMQLHKSWAYPSRFVKLHLEKLLLHRYRMLIRNVKAHEEEK